MEYFVNINEEEVFSLKINVEVKWNVVKKEDEYNLRFLFSPNSLINNYFKYYVAVND